jgi:hypothetical protein
MDQKEDCRQQGARLHTMLVAQCPTPLDGSQTSLDHGMVRDLMADVVQKKLAAQQGLSKMRLMICLRRQSARRHCKHLKDEQAAPLISKHFQL